MKTENLNFEEIMDKRRQAVEDSLSTISVAELRALVDELFPNVDHPWLEKFTSVINDPSSGTIHHAIVDDRVHILYCSNKDIGMWFILGSGKGPLEPVHLKVMKAIVQGNPRPS